MPLQTTKQPCCYPVNLQGWEDRWRQMVYCWATFAQAEVNEMSKLGSFLDYTSCCLFLTASVTTAVWIMINITILLSKLLEFVFHKGLCSTSGKKIFCMSFPQWFKNFFFFFASVLQSIFCTFEVFAFNRQVYFTLHSPVHTAGIVLAEKILSSWKNSTSSNYSFIVANCKPGECVYVYI